MTRRQHSRPFLIILTRLILCLCLALTSVATGESFVNAQPQRGDGIYSLLRRYQLPTTRQYVDKFLELNADVLGSDQELQLEFYYHMPILRYQFDGVTIRSTLGIDDYPKAKDIQNYNEALQRAGLRQRHYTEDKDLWVPYFFFERQSVRVVQPSSETSPPGPTSNFDIFGSAYSAVTRIDNSLEGYYFYMISGHGGPDPGAVGARGGYNLYEDEYAYDMTLRLARRLIEHGATVYVIVRDDNDGIRDAGILRGDHDEYYFGGSRISRKPVTRLNKRATVVNNLYAQNRKRAKGQYAIILHVDSRSNSQRIDLFYYYKYGHSAGRRLALALHTRVKKEYAEHQPGRGYGGTVTSRNLYMLRHVLPTTVYIEVANIRNKRDQDRLVIVNNRQAVANWLCEGVIDFIR